MAPIKTKRFGLENFNCANKKLQNGGFIIGFVATFLIKIGDGNRNVWLKLVKLISHNETLLCLQLRGFVLKTNISVISLIDCGDVGSFFLQ